MKPWLTRTELAEVSGLSVQSVGAWNKRPGCPKQRKGTRWFYEWPAWNEWRTAELVKDAREKSRQDRPADYEKAKARREEAEAGRAELKLRQERGELVELAAYRSELAAVVGVLARRIKAVPAKWSPVLVGCKTDRVVRTRLKPVVAELLTELAVLGDQAEDAA